MSPGTGEVVVSYRQEVTRTKDEIRIRYEVTPRRDLEPAATLVQIYLPVATHTGRPWLLFGPSSPRSGTFPPQLPASHVLLNEGGFDWLAWKCSDTEYLAVAPDWTGFSRVQVQDDRQFKGEHFEVQLYAGVPTTLAAGKTYSFAFTLKAMQSKEVESAREKADRERKEILASMTSKGPAALLKVEPNLQPVPRFGKLELSVQLRGDYTNPFDPEDVSLEAHFLDPTGKEQVVPGFFYADYARSRVGETEQMKPTGQSGWRVRYCPLIEGKYRYWLSLKDGSSEVQGKPATFQVVKSARPGFVRVSKTDPLYFEHDNHESYFAIGENVCWSGNGGTYDYDNYWSRLSAEGANYARLWIGPFDLFTLERVPQDTADPVGLGRYDLSNSWRLDYVIDQAEQKGLKVMFCIDSFNSLRLSEPYPMWQGNPYNAKNGGPLAKPEQFFTDPEARKYMKRRLRYIIARWSYSPAVLSWEFWNEVDIIEKYLSKDVVAWHQEMARYLRDLDPCDHLITTSWAGTSGDPAVDALPEIDYVQSHQYGARDEAAYMSNVCLDKVKRYGKPHYFGEFGTGTMAEGTKEDEDGTHLHNGLWTGVMSNAAGTCMLWWWDNYVGPKNLYYHFKPVANFVKGLPFNKLRLRPAQVEEVRFSGTPPPARLEALTLNPDQGSWTPAPYNQPNTFTLGPAGEVDPKDRLAKVLHGKRNHTDLHNPATFQVDYEKDGQFIVQVAGVSGWGGAKLKVYLDGDLKLDRDFKDEGDSNETMTKYDGSYPVEVPKGKHTIQVVNDGNDWFYVSYRLPSYRRRTDPGLQIFGLKSESRQARGLAAMLWIKDERYNWFNHNQGEQLNEIPPTEFTLSGLKDGGYEVQWWDTYTGEVSRTESASAHGGKLTVPVPKLMKDVACKIFRR
ncbi:MAG: DUF5060 domain-containing protein [Armatimonadetes bacterium]|nr:DUF5060 domain-containing protein [Armatimonadota bacterium]